MTAVISKCRALHWSHDHQRCVLYWLW